MIDIFLYPSAVPIVDIILSDPLRARSMILGRDDKPAHVHPAIRPRKLEPIVAKSLMRDLTQRYGAGNGSRIYAAMERERKGPFAPGAKYAGGPKRASTPPRIPEARRN